MNDAQNIFTAGRAMAGRMQYVKRAITYPPGDSTMLDLWQQKSGSPQMTAEARAVLRRDLNDVERNAQPAVAESYSRDANSEIQQQFPRLPNPDLVMYVFPHMTVGNVPVPGYSTVFPFYSQVQYALPGERVGAL